MKTTLALIMSSTFLFGCGMDDALRPKRQITIVLDQSDPHLLQTVHEDIPEIEQALQLHDDPWSAVDFRLVVLTDVAYNRVQELQLLPGDPDEENFIVRRNKAKAFWERVSDLIRAQATTPREEDASIIYLPLVLELERLEQCKTCQRELVVYSDMVEHLGKGRWSLYSDQLLDSLKRAPDAFEHHFERQRPMPELDGIKISIVNIPTNSTNSNRVSTIYSWYETLLESKGATVTISGNYHSPSLER